MSQGVTESSVAAARDHVWRNPELNRHFLEGVRAGIPLADEQLRVLLQVVAAARPEMQSFLDLGCGDGVLGRALAEAHPSARGVFVDFSPSMLAAARLKLGAEGARHTLLECDYGRADWTRQVAAYAPFQAIVSGFSIHHQPDSRKRSLYTEIFGLLDPGGIFLNLEHVASSSAWGEQLFDRHFVDALCAYHERSGSGKTREQIVAEYYQRPDKAANLLSPVEDQCRWLGEIGFERVDCFMKIFELALFGGLRPC